MPADITYGTNNEFGFDYLRDNMAFALADKVQRGQNYAIVDEVDSILIDEARTPLIISGPTDDDPELYRKINALIPRLKQQATEEGAGDFWPDEKSKQVHLTDAGHEKVEDLMREAGLLRRGRQPLRRRQHHPDASPQRAAARASPLSSRRRIHRAQWPGRHRRRVHRPHDDRTALVRRSAPGGRGQGRRADPAGKPDAGVASPSRTISACTRSCPA